jgi:hypothetical protein
MGFARLTRLTFLIGAASAALALCPPGAVATVSPAGTAFTATLTGSFTFTVGSFGETCTRSVIKGTTANPASSTISLTGGVNITITQTGGCVVTLGGVKAGSATWETHGTWDITAGTISNGSAAISLTVPNNAASSSVTPAIGTDCVLTINDSSLSDPTSTYTNANTSLVINDTTVNYTTNEGPCPASGGTGTITAQYSVTDALSVT